MMDVELNTNLKHETFLLRDAQDFAAVVTANSLGAPTQGSERANLIANPPSKTLEYINRKGTQQVNVTETKNVTEKKRNGTTSKHNNRFSLNTNTFQTSSKKNIDTNTIRVERIKQQTVKNTLPFYFSDSLFITYLSFNDLTIQ